MKHAAGVLAIAGAIVLAAVFACFPGQHDAVAMPLSGLGLFFSWAGLLLVPAGILWMVAERLGQRWAAYSGCAIATLTGALLVFASLAISFILAAALAAASMAGLLRLWRRARRMSPESNRLTSPMPFYLVFVPLVVFGTLRVIGDPVAVFARERAMQNGMFLIQEIERYRARRGEYPPSLVAINRDIHPGVIGIPEFEYERAGAAYNLFFESPNFHLGVREIVVYNPRDEHVMTSHLLDILQMTPEQLALDRTRGHNSVRPAGKPGWKYFWFD